MTGTRPVHTPGLWSPPPVEHARQRAIACLGAPTQRVEGSRMHACTHAQALLKLPSKKEKSALEALEAALEREKADGRAAAARHKLTVERLRCQIKELQVGHAAVQDVRERRSRARHTRERGSRARLCPLFALCCALASGLRACHLPWPVSVHAPQDRNHQLHEEVRWHEAQQLNSGSFAVPDGRLKRRPATATTS